MLTSLTLDPVSDDPPSLPFSTSGTPPPPPASPTHSTPVPRVLQPHTHRQQKVGARVERKQALFYPSLFFERLLPPSPHTCLGDDYACPGSAAPSQARRRVPSVGCPAAPFRQGCTVGSDEPLAGVRVVAAVAGQRRAGHPSGVAGVPPAGKPSGRRGRTEVRLGARDHCVAVAAQTAWPAPRVRREGWAHARRGSCGRFAGILRHALCTRTRVPTHRLP